jgi:CheY-like chemotaxis protein
VTILIIEDNEGEQMLLKEAFSECGSSAKLIFADTADEGLAILNEDRSSRHPKIQLLLLDLNLPRKNGKELLKELRADPRFDHIPIVILTSSNAPNDIYDCYGGGANCYLTKPTTFQELETMVTSVCRFWLKESQLAA